MFTTPAAKPANAAFKDADLKAWEDYKRNPTPQNRSALLNRFSGVINSQVNKWGGQVSRDVLMNEAKLLAAKAFDTYNPTAGAALATHVTNALLPLSRTVYTYQNTARMPENVTIRKGVYNAAVDKFKLTMGREPTTDELHSELGWSASDITRIRDYNRKDLLESGPAVSGDFFSPNRDDDDDMLLGCIYMELNPEEKTLFEHITGYNGARTMNNSELMQKFNMSQAQISYKKSLLHKKIEGIMNRPGIRKRFSR